MKRRELKNIIFNKYTIIILLAAILLFVLMYLSIKNEFFYNTMDYIHGYLDYYVLRYLGGDASKLIVNGSPLVYIEGDYVNIYSSLFLYVATFGTILFRVFTYIFPILIFYMISRTLHDEFYNKFLISKIMRIGLKKYKSHTIIVNGIYAGLILIIPKLLYLILLSTFFPVGISGLHYMGAAGFITQPYLYVGYKYSPLLMIFLDILMSFAYGFAIALISIIIIAYIRKKTLSYLIFIFSIAFLSIVAIFLKLAPITSYISLWSAFEQNSYFSTNISIFTPLIIIFSSLVVLFFVAKIVMTKKIKEFV